MSVERVMEYNSLPSEAALTTPYDDEISEAWPKHGNLEVMNLNVRYRAELPLSLNGLTFKVEGGERVGIVGRTGCGKSTLIQSLLRLLEAESGQILIDNTVSIVYCKRLLYWSVV